MQISSSFLLGGTALLASVASAIPAGYCYGCNEPVPFGTTFTNKVIYWHDWTAADGQTNCGQDTGADFPPGNWVAISSQYGTNGCGTTVSITYNGVTQEGTIIDSGAQDGGLNLSPQFFTSFGVAADVGFFYADYTFGQAGAAPANQTPDTGNQPADQPADQGNTQDPDATTPATNSTADATGPSGATNTTLNAASTADNSTSTQGK